MKLLKLKRCRAFKVGDKVFGMTDILFNGSAAEKIKISQKNFTCTEKYQVIRSGRYSSSGKYIVASIEQYWLNSKGTQILINGASGGVGSAIQMAKIYETEITAVTSDRNYEWIKNDFYR